MRAHRYVHRREEEGRKKRRGMEEEGRKEGRREEGCRHL
jgi:hypothetical protein